jgi:DNA repair protein RadC
VRVSELDRSERPREKLLALGPEALTDAELIAVLLRTGIKGVDVLEFARAWLEEAGGLEKLATSDLHEVLRRPGIGPAKATILAAGLELGRRLAHRQLDGVPLLDRPEAVGEYLLRAWSHERVEVFGALTLDARNRLLRVHELHRGGRAHAEVEPSAIFRAAIADNAHGVILWHTHPSGDPTPSEDDAALTRRLAEAGRLLGIAVLDHVVVGRGAWVSLRQRGLLPAQ